MDTEMLFRTATEELRQLREERAQQRPREQEMLALLAHREKSFRPLEEQFHQTTGKSPVPGRVSFSSEQK